MPKINITEVDLTTAGVELLSNIVYIPGFYPVSGDIVAGPHLFKNIGEFKKYFSDENENFNIPTIGNSTELEKSIVYALAVLQMGLPIIFDIIDTKDNNDLTTSFAYQSLLETKVKNENILEKLKDRNNYNISFITSGGYASFKHFHAQMIDVASSRGDCIALIDHEEDVSDTIDALFENVGTVFKDHDESSKFGAMFTPYCNFNFPNSWDLDSIKQLKNVKMPGSLAYLIAFGTSVANKNPNWLAVAGANRGKIKYLTETSKTISEAEIDKLALTSNNYNGVAINPITQINPYGILVWGNRTLYFHDGLVASSFLNIRHLCNTIKKELYTACKSITFEQNSDILWVKFKSMITPLLDQMQTSGGINGYQIKKEKSIKKATLKATIRIIPIEAVEDFDITLELADDLTSVTDNLQ